MFYSPLRYPGGKNKLAPFIAKICLDNKIHEHYIEPYAGGASVALYLLIEGYVKRITINDKDRSIYSFWYSLLNFTDDLCNLIDSTEVTMDNWLFQKEVQRNKEHAGILELGFSTLFLNRTNRSGIITGGVIGGKNQEGNYKLDCRFNRDEIKRRIRQIAKFKDCITLCNLDAVDLISQIDVQPNPGTLIYFDPPYYLKADQLYMNHYGFEDHKAVRDAIATLDNIHWIVSYDDHIAIEQLYSSYPTVKYSFNHSAGHSKSGKEIIFFSRELIRPIIEGYNPVNYKVKRKAGRKEIVYL